MAFIDNKLTAEIRNIQNLSRKPTPSEVLTYQQLQALYDKGAEDLRLKFNALIDNLISSTSGNSGSENIGSKSIVGLTGNTVYTQIANLLSLAQQAQVGVILPGVITDAMLSNDAGQIKTRFQDITRFGSWIDTSTSIAANGTYQKTIDISIAARKGRLIARGTQGTNVPGVLASFTTNINDGMSLEVNPIAAYNRSLSKSIDGYLSNNNSTYAMFGSNINLLSAYISGTNLILEFKNNSASVSTLKVNNLYWEVEL